MSNEKIIHIENLNVRYENALALKDICFDIHRGEFLGIMGPNGGGKSTLLKAILGLIPATSGKIEYAVKFKDIGYVPQFSAVDRNFPISVFEVVLSAMIDSTPRPFFNYSKEQHKNAFSQLEKVGIENLAKRQIAELSGGEFQRMLIARAIATKPQILFLDEPCASVDASSRTKIYSILKDLNTTVTIVMVTHDINAISAHISSIACLNQTLVYHGAPELTSEVVNALYGCPVELIAHGVPHRVLHTHGEGCTHD